MCAQSIFKAHPVAYLNSPLRSLFIPLCFNSVDSVATETMIQLIARYFKADPMAILLNIAAEDLVAQW